MKSYKNIRNLSLMVLAIFMANYSCTKDFKSQNTNPKLITEDVVTPELLLTSVEYNSASTAPNSGAANNYCGMAVSGANDPFVDFFDDGVWSSAYTTYANNLAAIIRITENNPDLINKKAIARILKAWVFSQATDSYGDIPYSQANLAPDKAIPSPKYDTQKSIYVDLFKELKEAAAELDPSKASYGNADLIYKGDVTKWKKFANSLRLRLALRVRYVDAQMATANMSDLQESDLILSRSDDALIYTSTDFPQHQNGNYNTLLSNGNRFDEHYIGKTILDILNNNNDPRIKIYADTAKLDGSTLTPPHAPFGYRGYPLLGVVPVEEKYPYGAGSTSRISDFWYVPVIEEPFLRSSEIYFALAEAALYNLRSGNANEYFKKGIQAGITQTQAFYDKSLSQMPAVLKIINPNWTDNDVNSFLAYKQMKQSEIDAFLASPATTLTGSNEDMLEQIMNQKMVALYPDGQEGWAEWRRTGYPRVLVAADEANGGISPRRWHYPPNERLINSANYNEAVGRMGGDALSTKVWWDANPDAPHKHPGAVESRATPWQ